VYIYDIYAIVNGENPCNKIILDNILILVIQAIEIFLIYSLISTGYLVAGKKVSKAPKIQRLVTPLTLQRKRARIADKKKRIAKAKSEAAEYQKLLASRLKEQRECCSESLAKKRSRISSASKAAVIGSSPRLLSYLVKVSLTITAFFGLLL
jgi:hypothetical protein